MNTKQESQNIMSIKEYAKLEEISIQTVYERINQKKLEKVKRGYVKVKQKKEPYNPDVELKNQIDIQVFKDIQVELKKIRAEKERLKIENASLEAERASKETLHKSEMTGTIATYKAELTGKNELLKEREQQLIRLLEDKNRQLVQVANQLQTKDEQIAETAKTVHHLGALLHEANERVKLIEAQQTAKDTEPKRPWWKLFLRVSN